MYIIYNYLFTSEDYLAINNLLLLQTLPILIIDTGDNNYYYKNEDCRF